MRVMWWMPAMLSRRGSSVIGSSVTARTLRQIPPGISSPGGPSYQATLSARSGCGAAVFELSTPASATR